MNRTESFSAFVERGDDLSTIAHSNVRLVTALSLRARLEAWASWREMPADGRRILAVNGAMRLPALNADVVFRRRPGKAASTEGERRMSSVLIPAGLTMPIPPQTLDFTAAADPGLAPLVVTPHLVAPAPGGSVGTSQGRATPLRGEVALHAMLDLRFTPKERFWRREAVVEFGGEIRFERNVTLAIALNDSGDGGTASPSATAEIVAMVAGSALPIPHRSASVQLAPNPWISVQLLDSRGQLEGEEHPLGRRVRIA